MNHRVSVCVIAIVQIIFITKVNSCFKDQNEFENWLIDPCYGNDQPDVLDKAMIEMNLFKLLLKEKLQILKVSPSIDYGNSCPNITRLVERLDRERKVRVFYNMLLKLAFFIHKLIGNIPNSYPQIQRKEMYSDILCHMKPVVCQFKVIQTGSRKYIHRKPYKLCTPETWNESYSDLFDKQFLQNFYRFFEECYVIFEDITYYDDSIITE